MGSDATPQDRAVASCCPLPASWGQTATCAMQGEYSIVGPWLVLCVPSLQRENSRAEEAAVTQSLLVGLAAFPRWMFPKLPTCQANLNIPNSLLFTIKSPTAKPDLFVVWIFCHLWSNSFYFAVSLSVKYFLQILSGFFFPCYPRIFNFCPIPASLAKINTPAAWKLWIRLFCVHSCHPWATIHLLSYLCVSSFRIISFIF